MELHDTMRINSKHTLMVAHRGVSGLERENTASAFVAAGNRSYYGVETDVHYTKDEQFVIIHDSNTSRVTDGEYICEETDLEILRNLHLKDTNGQERFDLRLPTLEEYISICKKYQKTCVLELKSDFSSEQLQRMCQIITTIGYLDRVIFIAFNIENLYRLRELYPLQEAQFLSCDLKDGMLDNLQKHHLDLDIGYTVLTKEVIDLCHQKGIKVNCWTVNDPDDAERLVHWGVDMITSNILEAL